MALAPITDGDRVVQAIATALGVKEQGGASVGESLSRYVSHRRLLVVLDNDTTFQDMLAAYVRTTEQAERFAVKSFSSLEQGFAFVQNTQEKFILLVHQDWFPLPEQVFRHSTGCMLCLSNVPALSEGEEYPVLFKFQPLNQLMAHVSAHYSEYSAVSPIVPCTVPLRSTQVNVVFACETLGGRTGFLACSPVLVVIFDHTMPAIRTAIMIMAINKPVLCHEAVEVGRL